MAGVGGGVGRGCSEVRGRGRGWVGAQTGLGLRVGGRWICGQSWAGPGVMTKAGAGVLANPEELGFLLFWDNSPSPVP